MSRGGEGLRTCSASEAGFSLVAVIFLIVVLAALAAFAVQVAMTQYQSSNTQLLEVRAQAAADAGIEYEANLTLRPSPLICVGAPSNGTFTLPNAAQALQGFVLTVSCNPTTHQIYSPSTSTWTTYTVFGLTATASYGTYGEPDYVARSSSRNVTLAPP